MAFSYSHKNFCNEEFLIEQLYFIIQIHLFDVVITIMIKAPGRSILYS